MVRYLVQIVFGPVLVLGIPATGLRAQTLSLAQALDAAEQYHPATRGASLQVQEQQQLVPAAAGFSNPVVTVESPTGNFYAIGVNQSFEMPAAYRRRKELQKNRVARAESAVAATRQDIRYAAALAYKDLQFQIALAARLHEQDSTLRVLAAAAARQFDQGQIDAVARQFAALQSARLHIQVQQAEQDVLLAENQLQRLTGLNTHLVPELWTKPGNPVVGADSTSWQNNPALQIFEQENRIAEQQVAVEKTLRWPQITLGYLNQGERNSPVANRFNIGVTLPLWRRQYQAQVEAAQTGVEIARQHLATQSLQVEATWRQALGEAEKARQALEAYEQTVLPIARSLDDASRRLFEGGLSDLPGYLRNRKEALDTELAYWDLQQAYEEALLNVQFAAGKL